MSSGIPMATSTFAAKSRTTQTTTAPVASASTTWRSPCSPQPARRAPPIATANVRLSYSGVILTLLVGICGGVLYRDPETEILLGDVVVSSTLVQYDFGKQYSDRFVPRDITGDSPCQTNNGVRSSLAVLETDRELTRLKSRTANFLREIQEKSRQRDRNRR
ncbi:hypothetical protein VTK56DRAFT_10002 [Thermocarpiscus australiensis]